MGWCKGAIGAVEFYELYLTYGPKGGCSHGVQFHGQPQMKSDRNLNVKIMIWLALHQL